MSECWNICWPECSISTGGWCWWLPSLSEQPSVLHTLVMLPVHSPSPHQGQSGNTLEQKLLIGIRSTFVFSFISKYTGSQCQCSDWFFLALHWLQMDEDVVSSCSASNRKPAEIEIWEKDNLLSSNRAINSSSLIWSRLNLVTLV